MSRSLASFWRFRNVFLKFDLDYTFLFQKWALLGNQKKSQHPYLHGILRHFLNERYGTWKRLWCNTVFYQMTNPRVRWRYLGWAVYIFDGAIASDTKNVYNVLLNIMVQIVWVFWNFDFLLAIFAGHNILFNLVQNFIIEFYSI